jgi:nickel/cobalt transporter (NicO) family protein
MRIIAALLILLALLFSQASFAQSDTQTTPIDKSRLLVQQRGANAPAFAEHPILWLGAKQREFYGTLSKSLRQIKSDSPVAAAGTLLLVSFLYGIFHAAGPGHGKAVVSAWILANKSDLRRGMLIAFMSAMIQALTAILIVSGLMIFFSNATALAKQSAGVLDSVSFAMIAGVGLYLMWTTFRSGHSHHHDHHHDHVHDASCGHAHAPTPAQVRGDASFLQMLSLAFAVGIRPCSGAILMLVFAWSAGIYWAGVVSAIIMGLGVFLTIAAIASLSVYAKSWAIELAGADNARMERITQVLKFGGGAVIAGFGLLLFLGSLESPTGFL